MPSEEEKKSPLDNALSRFNSAIDMLDTTIDCHLESQRSIVEAEDEVQYVNSDRATLAESLDKSEARAARLEDINKEVSRRLVTAMESIRNVVNSSTVT